jgi:hypothetical protein
LMPKSTIAVGSGKKNLQEILKIYNPLERIVLAFIHTRNWPGHHLRMGNLFAKLV